MLLEYHGISTSAICLSFRTGFLWRGHRHRRHQRHLKSLIILMIKARQSALGQSTEGTCTSYHPVREASKQLFEFYVLLCPFHGKTNQAMDYPGL